MSTLNALSVVMESLEMEESTKRSMSDHTREALIDFLGGVAGGTASVYVGQPLDTVKVKMQTFPTLYKNVFDCFKTTLFKEGIYRGLYAGTVPSLAAQVSETSVLLMAYGMCQKVVASLCNKEVDDLSVFQKAIGGSFAAIFSSLTLCPTELVKCKQQAMQEMISTGRLKSVPKHHAGPLYITKEILRNEGINGLYRGLTSTWMREMPGNLFFFGGYEIGRILLTPEGKTVDEIGPLRTLACGGLGGASFWISIFPVDVVKSRIQVQSSSSTTFLGTFASIYKHEGISAFYKGLGPTVARTIPATAMLFLAYETTKKMFNARSHDTNSS